MKRLGKLVRVRTAEVVEAQVVRVAFEDGSIRQIDLAPLMHGAVFDELLNDPELFRTMDVKNGVLTWPNGADIDPDVLYCGLTPASVTESD